MGTQTHSHASRVARNVRQEICLFTRLSWLRIFQGHARGEDGRQQREPCSSPNSWRRTAPCWIASYVTTSSHGTFEKMVRTHGNSPTSSFLSCSLFGDALGLPQGAYLDFHQPREWRAEAGHYREIFAAYGVRPQDTVLELPNRSIYILPYVQEFLAGLDSTWEDFLTRWTFRVRNALEEGKALPPFPTAAWTLGSQKRV